MDYTTPNKAERAETIDIKKYLYKILANLYWFAISIFISLSVAYMVNRYTTPIYSVSATIIVRDDESRNGLIGAENLIPGMKIFRNQQKVQNEIGILQSHNMAKKTISQLNFDINYIGVGTIRDEKLYTSSPFQVNIDTAKNQLFGNSCNVSIINKNEYMLIIESMNIKKRVKFGEQFENDKFSFNITLRDSANFNENKPNAGYRNFNFFINDRANIINEYCGKLSVGVNNNKGSVLTLTTQGANPQQEVDYLNKLSEVYIKAGLAEKNQTAINTISFINSQLENIVDSLSIVETDLQDFRLNNNTIIKLDAEGGALYGKISLLQNEKANIVIKLKYCNYLFESIQQKKNIKDVIVPSGMGVNDPILNSLFDQLNKFYGEKVMLQYSSKENNPLLQIIDFKIKNTTEALVENIKNIIESTNISLKDINERIAKETREIQKLPVTERRLLGIQRKFNLNDNIYNFMLQKRAEAEIAKASNIADNKILDVARVDNATMISPKSSLNISIALIIGIVVPFVLLILKEFLNNKITDRKDIENHTFTPILGAIGHNDKSDDLVVFKNPKSSISESFRSLRTNLQYILKENKGNVIILTSTISGEGKTFCAINLASIIAMSNKKTIILGLDLRKPQLNKLFDMSNEIGISTYLINKNTLEEITYPTEIENLHIMPSGPIPPNPAELLETKKMEELIDILKVKYDYIVLDTPPVALVTDALLLSKFSAAAIFVIRQNYSNKTVANFVDDLYTGQKFSNLSILINDVKVSSSYGYRSDYGYEYGYGYGYGYGHKSGYGYYEEDVKPMSKINKTLKFLKIKK